MLIIIQQNDIIIIIQKKQLPHNFSYKTKYLIIEMNPISVSMTDEKIMTRISKGELDGAKILYDRYHVRIYNFFLRLTFNRDVSLDLMQNVFYRIIKYRKSWKEKHDFIPWIFRISRNEYNDYMKKEGKYLSNAIDLEEINESSAGMIIDPAKSDQVKNLQNALAKISPEHRKILLLSKYMKLKNKEIAVILESNENAVKGMIFRAMCKLREVYFKLDKT
jgi:RNA polymerase sigma factor (sigma-70 family)